MSQPAIFCKLRLLSAAPRVPDRNAISAFRTRESLQNAQQASDIAERSADGMQVACRSCTSAASHPRPSEQLQRPPLVFSRTLSAHLARVSNNRRRHRKRAFSTKPKSSSLVKAKPVYSAARKTCFCWARQSLTSPNASIDDSGFGLLKSTTFTEFARSKATG